MAFKTRLINFLLPLSALLLFLIQWVRKYAAIMYANIPEETQYLRYRPDQLYSMLAQAGGVLIVLFLVAGLAHLFRPNRLLGYGLIVLLLFSGYLVFLFSLSLPRWNTGAPLNFMILVMLAVSACRYYIYAHAKIP
jgi:hypothetical protein